MEDVQQKQPDPMKCLKRLKCLKFKLGKKKVGQEFLFFARPAKIENDKALLSLSIFNLSKTKLLVLRY